MSKFDEFFEEPVSYWSDGYAVSASTEQEAIEKFTEYFMDWHWIPREHRKYVIYQIRSTIHNGWVKWHGFINDEGETQNGWVLYKDMRGGQNRFRHLYVAQFNKHYAETGHHFEPTIDEYGHRFRHNDCNICGKVVLS